MLPEELQQQGPFAPRALPRFDATMDPSDSLSPSAAFPCAGYTAYLARRFLAGTRRVGIEVRRAHDGRVRWPVQRFPLGLSPAPMATTIPQAPLRSRRWDFPSPVLTLAFLRGLPRCAAKLKPDLHTPRPRWFTPRNSSSLRAQRDLGSVSERRTGTAKCPEPLCCMAVLPPRRRCPASPRRTLLHFIAPTAHAPDLLPSLRLRPSPRTPGLCRLLSAPAGHRPFRRCLCQSFPACLDPTPAAPGCTCPLLPPGLWPPGETSGRRDAISRSYFSRGQHNGAAVIH